MSGIGSFFPVEALFYQWGVIKGKPPWNFSHHAVKSTDAESFCMYIIQTLDE